MRAILPLLCVGALGCGADPAADDTCRRVSARTPQALELGVAHVAGDYHPSPTVPFLAAGANDAAFLGARTLKVYLTPEYRTKYPGDWAQVASLAELAQTPQFRALFEGPFDTFVVTAYSFALGVGDPWRTSDEPGLYAAEADELEVLARHLLVTYAGTHKRFVLQTWEGDWALRAGLAADEPTPPARVQRMTRWLDARQRGVARARAAVSAEGVEVLNALELNLVQGPAAGDVLTQVVPQACADAVSYSAWDALAVRHDAPLDEKLATVRRQLREAVSRVRAALPEGVELSLGEFGFAEAEHPQGHVPALIDATIDTARELGVSRAVYWQLYDNECTAAGCRGLWLVRPDGSWSEAAWAITARLKSPAAARP